MVGTTFGDMSDLISREKAVQGVRELFSMGDCYCDELSIVGMLNGLPLAESERTAKVNVLYRDESVIFGHCKCGQAVNTYGTYCHKCGAKLEWE